MQDCCTAFLVDTLKTLDYTDGEIGTILDGIRMREAEKEIAKEAKGAFSLDSILAADREAFAAKTADWQAQIDAASPEAVKAEPPLWSRCTALAISPAAGPLMRPGTTPKETSVKKNYKQTEATIEATLQAGLSHLAELRRTKAVVGVDRTRHTLTVTLDGKRRTFTPKRMSVSDALEYAAAQEAIATLCAQACDRITDDESRRALTERIYLEGIAETLVELLATPADDGPPLTLADCQALGIEEAMRVLAEFEDFAGITAAYEGGQELRQLAMSRRSRQLQQEIDALEAVTT